MHKRILLALLVFISAEILTWGQVYLGAGYEQIHYKGDFYGNHTLPALNLQSSYEFQCLGSFISDLGVELSFGNSFNHVRKAVAIDDELLAERTGRWSEAHLRIPALIGHEIPLPGKCDAFVKAGPKLDFCLYNKFANGTNSLPNPYDCKYRPVNLYIDGMLGIELNDEMQLSCGISWAPFPFSKEYIYVHGTRYYSSVRPLMLHLGISLKLCD